MQQRSAGQDGPTQVLEYPGTGYRVPWYMGKVGMLGRLSLYNPCYPGTIILPTHRCEAQNH
eukprot:2052739-Rhodomonas_salina.1